MDLFSTRTMLAALEQLKPARTFILDTFFKTVDVSTSESVDIDIDRGGNRQMAPFVSRSLEGKVVEKRNFQTRTYKPPYVKPKMVTTAADILKRQMGETIYTGNRSPAQRAAEQLGKDLASLDTLILRREEWMATQALLTGEVVCKGDGYQDTLSFGMLDSHKETLLGTSAWSDTANSTPIQDLQRWARQISKDSGLQATDIVMGRSAAANFMANTKEVIGTNGKLNQLKLNNGQIDVRALPNGVKYYGFIADPGVDVWGYDEWYWDDEANVQKEMIPANKVLMGCSAARCVRHYGAISDLECIAAVPRFPKSWVEKDPSAQIVMLQSATLPAPHQIDGFFVATVQA
jgi:hypothetical protein